MTLHYIPFFQDVCVLSVAHEFSLVRVDAIANQEVVLDPPPA